MDWVVGDESNKSALGSVAGLIPAAAQGAIGPAVVPAVPPAQQVLKQTAMPVGLAQPRPTLGVYKAPLSPSEVSFAAGLLPPAGSQALPASAPAPAPASARPAFTPVLGATPSAQSAIPAAPAAPGGQAVYRYGNTYTDIPRTLGDNPAPLDGGTFNVIPASPPPGAGGFVLPANGAVMPPIGGGDRSDAIQQLQQRVQSVANKSNPSINELVSANLAGRLLNNLYGYDANQTRSALDYRAAQDRTSMSGLIDSNRIASDAAARARESNARVLQAQVDSAARSNAAAAQLAGQQASADARIQAARIGAEGRTQAAKLVASQTANAGIKYPPTVTDYVTDPVTKMQVQRTRYFLGVDQNNIPQYVTQDEAQKLQQMLQGQQPTQGMVPPQ